MDSSVYYPKWKSRDYKARLDYKEIKDKSDPFEGTYILDIVRQQWRNDDERL